jgi:dTMP kinase
LYIVLEGIDTCGKSTQILALKGYFKNAIFTCEPGGTKIGNRIRDIILNDNVTSNISEMFLFLADRAEHTENILVKNSDNLIISDRSMVSGIAYAKEFEFSLLKQLNFLATQNITPDLVILLQLTEQELIDRLENKTKDRVEQRGIKYLLDIQSKIVDICDKLAIEVLKIDASFDVDKITSIIIKKIEEKLDD